jgi:hypothetical protein
MHAYPEYFSQGGMRREKNVTVPCPSPFLTFPGILFFFFDKEHVPGSNFHNLLLYPFDFPPKRTTEESSKVTRECKFPIGKSLFGTPEKVTEFFQLRVSGTKLKKYILYPTFFLSIPFFCLFSSPHSPSTLLLSSLPSPSSPSLLSPLSLLQLTQIKPQHI